MENKVKYGLSQAVVFPITDDTKSRSRSGQQELFL